MPESHYPVYLEICADREAVHFTAALLFDEGVYEEIGQFCTRSPTDIEAHLRAFDDGSLQGGQLHWAIRDRNTHACFGSLQATMNLDGCISIGYRVRSESQDRGIATEALRLLIKELNLKFPERALVASVDDPQNAASRRVLAKCGFRANSIGTKWTYQERHD